MAKVISKNKDAFFNFQILSTFEAGIELNGWEVKSIRDGNVVLRGSFCSFVKDELFVSNMNVSNYMSIPGNRTRPRKLLLHKRELRRLKETVKVKGNSIVAITLKWSRKGKIKLDIGIGKGKNRADKREVIKKRDFERQRRNKY
ncbi:SsrA-binding protein SmpB [Candidatus Mycoplasma mahonii]|uniref:SsrA-binding protein SmpB n=1 Tax=Candidatus Mycoplasma mahonii TaxID=3004105 RepID=UPI0026EE68E4|nr:SsrA-binding protein SmpB [Candidatus Mycoplasma mahonii]WKX02511.1 SsrA-binding protein SmpB [Candidatus Mycoplasma mahonii]